MAEPAMLVFADTVDAPGAAERSPLRRNLLIATTAAGVAVRASPLALALASSPLERVQTSSTLRPTVAASSYLRLQPQALLRLQVGLLLSLLKLLLQGGRTLRRRLAALCGTGVHLHLELDEHGLDTLHTLGHA